ncbi:hypothetical protein SLS62_007771 [Diatrype stigma]|uniref:Ketoreductase domain-containing protein n=1 Tax=Diatrype stigma TaxID=117547 RepID=A0AAN9UW20_9PEZI
MAGNVWFITGASNGFGHAIALEALRRGDKVVATSRKLSKMADLKEAGALTLALDVTASDEVIQAVLKQAIDAYGKVTYLINAAGYILEGPIEAASPQEIQHTFATNVFGTMNVTRNALHHMRPQRTSSGSDSGSSAIATFGSIASWEGGPAYGYYAATKWAVSGFTESLRAEVAPFGIAAVVVEPGYFRTGFLNPGGGNRLATADAMRDEYRDTPVEAVRRALDGVDDNQPGDVAKGARVIVDVLTRTGVAAGKDIPVRLPLGSDGVEYVRKKLQSTEVLLGEWEDIARSTDREE